jgi:hypothetical protein
MLHFNHIIMGLLTALAACMVHAQDAAPAQRVLAPPVAANADDARIQQYVQLLQPTMWRELDFVRLVCDLKPEQRPKVKAAADVAVKEAAKTMLKPQRQPMTMFATKAVRDGINDSLKQMLTAEQLDHFQAEASSRDAATKKAAIQTLVSQIDGILFLSHEQRENISATLDKNWQPDWEYWLNMRQHQFGEQYLPQVPDQHIVPHLTAEQRVVWTGLQKIMFNAWQNNGRRQADDAAWWAGKTDNAAKTKAVKGKAAAKAAVPLP